MAPTEGRSEPSREDGSSSSGWEEERAISGASCGKSQPQTIYPTVYGDFRSSCVNLFRRHARERGHPEIAAGAMLHDGGYWIIRLRG
jgi:hypothetical protein